VELELQPDRALDVRLVDAQQAAVAGAVVELRRRLSDGNYLAHTRQRTDGEGRARLGHLQWMRPEAEGIALEHFVGAEVLTTEAVQVAVDPAHWPSEELVLQLPGMGAVIVDLIGPGGEPWRGDGQVEIGLARNALARIRAAGGDIPVASSLRAIRAGRATLERVGLGLELELFVNPDGWKQHLATISGPTRAGETVTAPVQLSEPAPSIRGRIVDHEGRPLARDSLSCELWSLREPQHQIEHRRSDDSGRFTGFGGPYLLDGGSWSLFFSIPGEPQRAARVTLAAPVAAGQIELGDVVLDLPPLLARGSVADERSHPVRAAKLLFQEKTEVPWRRGTFDWFPLPRGAVASAPDGSFELRGWTRSERLQLSVHRPGYERVEPLEFSPPAEDLRLVLRSEGAIAGRILTTRGRVQGMVDLSVHDERGAFHGGGITWGADGAFRIGGLRSGSYTLQLRQWSHYPGSHAWPGIVVRSGETAEIGDIALDELVTLLRFDLRDQSGAPIPDALIRWSISGGEHLAASGVLEKDSSGTHLLPTLELPLSVELEAPGFLPAKLEDVRTDQRVVLTRGPHVQLVLGGLPRLGEHWSVWARLERGETTEASAVFDTKGRTSLYLGHSGPFHVGLWLQHGGETGFKSLAGLGWQIEVADSQEEQVFLSPEPTPEFFDNLARLTR
ncbi:MAG: carboxypeptidase regulatory-like domain-containing protein, partial [Planctomycetes bacterium]|nr:carboxypeptidase regulatory-like domain-containing protein [Planctomycetota bacterium]